MTKQPKRDNLRFEIAQLRHAYAHLVAGRVKDQRRFAEGLLGPVIERMEERDGDVG